MKTRKILALLMSLLMVVGLMAGCSSKANSSSSASSDQKYTITCAIWDTNQAPVMKLMAQQFTKENPNITVDVQTVPWGQYWVKLQTAAAGGECYDTFWMSPAYSAQYVRGKVMMQIDSKIKESGVDMSQYPSALTAMFSFNKKTYAMPRDRTMTLLYYNKTLFDVANISYPDETWTWDKLVQVAQKLTNKSEGIYGMGALNGGEHNFYNTIPQCGGYVISDDQKKSGYDLPATQQGVQMWVDLINQGISPTIAQLTDTSQEKMFMAGKLAMFYGGDYNMTEFNNSDIKGKYDVSTIVIVNGKRINDVVGLGNAIWSQTKYPDAAWKWTLWQEGKEGMDMLSNIVQPAYTPSITQYMAAHAGLNTQALLEEAKNLKPYPSSIDAAKWRQVESDQMVKAFTGQETVAKACNDLATQMNQLLAAEPSMSD